MMKSSFLLSHSVERSAEHAPDHQAFRFLDQVLTYADVDEKSNQLARHLHENGVRRGDRVAIFLNKCIETPIAVYGILKAGAAYVPLDPAAPVPRLQSVLQDCRVQHVVTHQAKAKEVRQLVANETILHVVGIDNCEEAESCTSWEMIYDLPASRLVTNTTEQDLAYIMYTSGSTGTPKGIMHTHASGLSYARLSADTYDVDSTDVLSNHSPLHFDMSTFDFLTGPLCGATTVIISEAHARLPASLSQLIQDESITIWYSVPFALIQLLLHGVIEKRDLSSLRWVLFGGEPFPPKYLAALMQLWPNARFSNVYGPAEVNQCTFYHLPTRRTDWNGQIPIGKVWANSEGIVVDTDDCLVPVGEPGELLIRSPTMMRGYWGRSDLNEKAFFYRSITSDVHDVFYRTGDLVRVQADGEMQFLGRKDRQIKVRGHRVELDEVESVLASHPHVKEAAAYDVPSLEDTRQIEAAVVLRADMQATEKELKDHVSSRLPIYAIPHLIRIMATFPRTATDKIDRRQLQEEAIAKESNGET